MITGPTGTTCLSDTAQVYRNEMEAGQALRESGIPRSEIFITTKYSGLRDVETSIQDSLKYVSSQVASSLSLPFKFHHKLGVSYVDLYLIHSPRLAQGDIPGLWSMFEGIHARGLAR